ncbi:MAG: suppressor of fused domain protein [Pirellulaceae bacterium]|nr:suppressor of fused domain protein [Pirellulaceae bacterium]
MSNNLATSEFDAKFEKLIETGAISDLAHFLQLHPRANETKCFGTQPWLKVAIAHERPEIVKFLLENRFDPNEDNGPPAFVTPLGSAISSESFEIFRALLEYGANVNGAAPDRARYPIAAVTSSKDTLKLIKLLEKYGADLDKDYMHNGFKKMINALSMAQIFEKQDVGDYLRSKGLRTPEEKAAASQSVKQDALLAPKEPMHEVFDYFNKIVGTPEPLSIIQIVPTGTPISIHAIPSAPDRPYVTLFTTGLSDHRMNVPEGEDDWAHAELYIQLPAGWKYKEYSDPNWGWPQHWLRSMAQHPSQNNTWLGGPVALVANEDPPRPLAPNTTFTTLSTLVDRCFTSRDGHTI